MVGRLGILFNFGNTWFEIESSSLEASQTLEANLLPRMVAFVRNLFIVDIENHYWRINNILFKLCLSSLLDFLCFWFGSFLVFYSIFSFQARKKEHFLDDCCEEDKNLYEVNYGAEVKEAQTDNAIIYKYVFIFCIK